jgi:hypothetical protein
MLKASSCQRYNMSAVTSRVEEYLWQPRSCSLVSTEDLRTHTMAQLRFSHFYRFRPSDSGLRHVENGVIADEESVRDLGQYPHNLSQKELNCDLLQSRGSFWHPGMLLCVSQEAMPSRSRPDRARRQTFLSSEAQSIQVIFLPALPCHHRSLSIASMAGDPLWESLPRKTMVSIFRSLHLG